MTGAVLAFSETVDVASILGPKMKELIGHYPPVLELFFNILKGTRSPAQRIDTEVRSCVPPRKRIKIPESIDD